MENKWQESQKAMALMLKNPSTKEFGLLQLRLSL
jgi:hypothetical protein